jgi:predicted nucleotidyltransferase
LVAAYTPDRIYLFGSASRGDTNADSDYDLMMIVPDDAAAERRSAALAYDALWTLGAAVDVLVWTKTAFDRRAHLKASLPGTVLREGTLVHAA